jgi:hypothetical protein
MVKVVQENKLFITDANNPAWEGEASGFTGSGILADIST